ncbi:proline iminopeptidase-family hydrolase [Lapillicoccus sp.]|uniref:proline iminopeptidase-family hydrolase n=1 Tax=Lapillicoccus sp. TaxID=1909287 RepID=UPI0025F16E27|nr:proline iminopeptidase-family hydrolase [Lapillicoccus sp.]
MPRASREGTVDFRGFETWYRITGDLDSGQTPLVVLHGGPGVPHDYTLRIAGVAATGRAVIHYDQLGCGNSTHLRDRGADFWTVELFLDELDNLLSKLDVAGDYSVLGQSWGGMLGAEHAARQPAGLRALVIANSPASMELWLAEANRLRGELPAEVQATLLAHEQAGTTDSAEYAAAEQVFYDRHVCRVVPNPPEVAASFAKLAEDPTVYHTMNGPSEFHVIGTLKGWSIVDRAGRITAPTLLINGRYDEATDACMQPFADAIPDVRWERFAESSHLPQVEEEDRYLEVVTSFLASVHQHDRHDEHDQHDQPPTES